MGFGLGFLYYIIIIIIIIIIKQKFYVRKSFQVYLSTFNNQNKINIYIVFVKTRLLPNQKKSYKLYYIYISTISKNIN